MEDVVIGRMKVDNYLLSLMYKTGGYLIDTTSRGKIIHIHIHIHIHYS